MAGVIKQEESLSREGIHLGDIVIIAEFDQETLTFSNTKVAKTQKEYPSNVITMLLESFSRATQVILETQQFKYAKPSEIQFANFIIFPALLAAWYEENQVYRFCVFDFENLDQRITLNPITNNIIFRIQYHSPTIYDVAADMLTMNTIAVTPEKVQFKSMAFKRGTEEITHLAQVSNKDRTFNLRQFVNHH